VTAERARKLPVPDATGLVLAVAEKVIRNAGFAGARVHYVESYEASGTVVGQDPPRGSLLESDRPVTVRVAKESLIRFLPTVYQPRVPEDRVFLRDFLWIVQHLFDGVGRKIDTVHELFDAYATPPDFLPWLASWFAISFDDTMDEARRRRVLKECATLYRVRGTRGAIERMVKLFTDVDVSIEENRWPYRGFRIGVSSSIGVDTMVLPEVSMSHTFVVKVPATFEEIGEDTLVRLHQVISAEKPASTNYFLQFRGETGVSEYGPFLRVGVSAIGVDEGEGTGTKAEESSDA
jgi:phage tail-like protein